MNEKFYSHSTAIIENPDNIGEGTKIWHFSHVMSNCIIGKNCTIGQNVFISSGAIIGNNVKIQNNISIYDGIICEDDVFLGPSAVFTNVLNPRSQINRKNEFKKTIIMKGATIGANSTIVCGNNIGKYAFIGAGSVVTKTVKNYSLVVGNPSKQIGWISEYGNNLQFDKNNIAKCDNSNSVYEFVNDEVFKLK